MEHRFLKHVDSLGVTNVAFPDFDLHIFITKLNNKTIIVCRRIYNKSARKHVQQYSRDAINYA